MFKNKYFTNTLIGISIFFATTCETIAFANDNCQETCCPKAPCLNSFTYFKLGGGVLSAKDWNNLVPGIGYGRRYQWGEKAVDLSINYAGSGKVGSFYTLPKIMYLHSLSPSRNNSIYVGGGLSWGGIHNKHHKKDHKHDGKHRSQKFQGIFGEFALGYEFQRNCPIRTFVEFNLSQGIIAHSKHGSTPYPILTLAGGIGF